MWETLQQWGNDLGNWWSGLGAPPTPTSPVGSTTTYDAYDPQYDRAVDYQPDEYGNPAASEFGQPLGPDEQAAVDAYWNPQSAEPAPNTAWGALTDTSYRSPSNWLSVQQGQDRGGSSVYDLGGAPANAQFGDNPFTSNMAETRAELDAMSGYAAPPTGLGAEKPWWQFWGGDEKPTPQQGGQQVSADGRGNININFGGAQEKDTPWYKDPWLWGGLALGGAYLKDREDKRKGDKEKGAIDAKNAQVQNAIAGMGANPFAPRNPFEGGGYAQELGMGGGGLGGAPAMTSQTPGWYTPGGYYQSSQIVGGGAYGPWGDPGSLQMGYGNVAPGTPIETSVLQRNLPAYMNPYLDLVADKTANQIDKDIAAKVQKQRDSSVSRGAFGGARQRLYDADLQRQLLEGKANALADIFSGGYNTALGAAQKDLDRGIDWNKTNLSSSLAGRTLGLDWLRAQADYDLNKARILAGLPTATTPTSNYGQILMSGGLAGLGKTI